MANRQTNRFAQLWRFAALLLCIVVAGCHSLNVVPPVADHSETADKDPAAAIAAKRSFRVSQFFFLPDFDLQQNLPLFEELGAMREQVYRELQLPPSSTVIQVHIFADRPRYDQFMHGKYPFLPNRRAFFVAQQRAVGAVEDLLVYTYWGDRIREDLRHELTHALLHSVLKNVPLWLDEGLAEYFEVGAECQGTHVRHLEQIRADGGTVGSDLTRLEAIGQVQQMTSAEYREAWAWVHLMLRDKAEAKAVLLEYLRQLRLNPNPGPLQPRLAVAYENLDDALNKHLATLDASSQRIPAVSRYDDDR
jgi:hypothetical protein